MQISNPLSNPIFFPLMMGISVILLIGIVLILFVVTKKKEKMSESSLFVRWRTWAVLAPLAVGFTLSGAHLFALWVMACSLVCITEVSNVVGLSSKMRLLLLVLTPVIVLTAAFQSVLLTPLMVACLLLVAVVAIAESDGTGFDRAALGMLALCYVPLLGSHAIFLQKIPGGDGLLLAIITSSAVANVGAFCFGKLFGGGGKHKLSPHVSPNKTWEGVGGSVVGAYVGFFALSWALQPIPLQQQLIIPVIVAVTGIIGDLFESLMKRSYGVKDAGTWLPGFGGLMDRVDGLLFVLPAVYYFVVVAKVV